MITFETAWGFSGEIMSKLSEKYPDVVFNCKFADEGIKENSGIVNFKNGQVISEKYNLSTRTADNIWNTYIEETTVIDQDVDSQD